MKTIKTTEKFDKDGNLVERVTETVETIEAVPFHSIQYPQPIIIHPQQPSYPPFEITCGINICETTAGGVQ